MPPKGRKAPAKGKAKAAPKRARKAARVESAASTVASSPSATPGRETDSVASRSTSLSRASTTSAGSSTTADSDDSLFAQPRRGGATATITKRARAGTRKATPKRSRSNQPVTEIGSADESGDDGDTSTTARDATRGVAVGGWQRTLDGRVCAPSPKGRAGGGELQPSRPAAEPTGKRGKKVPADDRALFLEHLRYALARHHLKENFTRIHLVRRPARSWDGRDADTDGEESAAAKMICAPSVCFAVPCLHLFMVQECVRAARIAESKGKNPLLASLTLFGFLIDMCEKSSMSFAALLYICCPACRFQGLPHPALELVLTYLMETERMTLEEMETFNLMNLRASIIKNMPGRREDGSGPAGGCIGPERCCPCGDTHVFLSSFTILTTNRYDGRMRVSHSFHPWPGLEEAAKAARAVYALELSVREKYVEKARFEQRERYRQSRTGQEQSTRGTAKNKKAIPEPDFTPHLQGLSHTLFADAEQRVRNAAPGCARWDKESSQVGVDAAYYADLMKAKRFAFDNAVGCVRVSVSFTLGLPRERTLTTDTFANTELMGEHLWALFLANNHAVMAVCSATDKGEGCSCNSLEARDAGLADGQEKDRAPAQNHARLAETLAYLEYHGPFLRRTLATKEADQLVPLPESGDVASTIAVPTPVDVEATEQQRSSEGDEQAQISGTGVGGAHSYYTRSTFDRHQFMCSVTETLTQQQLVDYAALEGVTGLEADPAIVPRDLIKADLKRHQLEDVQWMCERERNGAPEFVELPVYDLDPSSGTVQRKGSYFYCGTTAASCFAPSEGTDYTLLYSLLRGNIRGGFLGDDVGLGKTLTLLTVCARDAQERQETREREKDGASGQSAKATTARTPAAAIGKTTASTSWEVYSRAATARERSGLAGKHIHPLSPSFVQQTYGFGKLRRREGLRLPATTLVVVPMSIAGQWIGEIERFYPSAKYILYYGTKRHRYTVEDMAEADFVITTYETIAVHLRKENEGEDRLLMDVVAASTSLGSVSSWAKSQPAGFLALEHVGPFENGMVPPEVGRHQDLAEESSSRGRGRGGRGRGRGGRAAGKMASRGGGGTPAETAAEKISAKDDGQLAWTVSLCQPVEEEEAAALGSPAFERLEFSGPNYRVRAFKVVYKSPMSPDDEGCNEFLDAVWGTVRSVAASSVTPQRGPFVPGLGFLPSDCIADLLRYPFESAATQRQFVQHVILPHLTDLFTSYWKIAVNRLDADTGKVKGMMITDLIFRRVIFDECQKCGSDSLFHLLQGDRRWAVSGTPISNNNPATLAEPLRAVGALSASATLAESTCLILRRHNAMERHFLGLSNGHYFLNTQRSRVAFHYNAYATKGGLHEWTSEIDNSGFFFCFCAMCSANAFYGFPIATSREEIPRMGYPPRLGLYAFGPDRTRSLRVLPSILVQMLVRFVVRHERTEEVRQELSLRPVEHVAVSVQLTPDESFFYARYANIVSTVSSRLHREGRLANRMSVVLQWLQTLCRLALHPKGVSAQLLGALTVEDVYTEMLPASVAEFEQQLEKSFITMTAKDVLAWAQEQKAHPRIVKGSVINVPAETLEVLEKLAGDPPDIPSCGICLDQMVDPTVLTCYHLFCKECLMGVIQSGISHSTGNSLAKCPYCRDKNSMNDVKRIAQPAESEDAEAAREMKEEEAKQSQTPSKKAHPGDEALDDDDDADNITDEERFARIGRGSRAEKLLELLTCIWDANPDDGVLVFSKFPIILQHAHQEVVKAGYAPLLLDGGTTLARRRRITSVLQQQQQSASQLGDHSSTSKKEDRRALFVSSRAANAGLNLTFANHVIFLEPNMNPAVEVQAIGRVHRFGQLKHVKVYHMFAPGTIEEPLYHRSARILEQLERATEEGHQRVAGGHLEALANLDEVANDPAAMARREQLARLGRVEPTETALLLQYPPVLPPPS